MKEAMGKISRWPLQLSELVFDIVQRAEIKDRAANALSLLRTKVEDTTPLHDKVPVMTVSLFCQHSSKLPGDNEHDFIKESQDKFISFLTDVLALTENGDGIQTSIPTFLEFIREQSKDRDCRIAIFAVGQPNLRFSITTDEGLVRVSTLVGSLPRYVQVILRPRVKYLCYYSVMDGCLGERCMYSLVQKCTVHICQEMCTPQYMLSLIRKKLMAR